jgi:hypothetical protein
MLAGGNSMAKPKKVSVTDRALLQRINRVVAKDGLRLKKSKRGQSKLGDFYIINTKSNVLVSVNVDIEALGRKHGVLAAWEELSC